MRLRIQEKNKKETVQVPDDATLASLLDVIETTTNLPMFSIKIGFPPKNVDLTEPWKTLKEVGIRSGDCIIVESVDTAMNFSKMQATSTTSFKPSTTPRSEQVVADSVPASNIRQHEVLQDTFSFGAAAATTRSTNDHSSPPEIEVPQRGQGARFVVHIVDRSC